MKQHIRVFPLLLALVLLLSACGRQQKAQPEQKTQLEQTAEFLEKLEDLIAFLLPNYREEGKSTLIIAVGCTGGRHRSVAMTHALAEDIRNLGYRVRENHRDMNR